MRNNLILLLIVAAVISCNGQQKHTVTSVKTLDINAIESKIDDLVKKYQDIDIFSGVVLVAQEGNVMYHKPFGLANREKKIPNTINTRFDIGSMNKSFTKVLILKLVSDGKLRLDDNLGKYLDGFPPEAANKVTIEHLLNHESGFGGYHTPEYWNIPSEKKNLDVALNYIKTRPLLFEPGTETEYSNAGYVILGMIAQKAGGKSYFDLVEEKITKPLGMKNTYLREKYTVPNRAIGYYKSIKGELRNNDSFNEIVTPAGGFYSTTTDILKFYRAFHYGEELWDEETRALDGMYDFYQEHKNSGGAMTHAGGFEGANTVLYEVLRDKISIIVFANMDEVVAEDLGKGILSIVRGKEPIEPALPAAQMVYEAMIDQGADYVRKNWERLTTNFHPADPKDLILNEIGYELLSEGNTSGAIAAFKLNIEMFPEVANCYDSYGEALLKKGDKEAALKAYEKALSLDPGMPSAQQAVKELRSKGK